jgi:hypothetical protein
MSEQCQFEAEQILQKIVEGHDEFGWCNVKESINALNVWFDSSRSWADSAWLDISVWNPRINYGQNLIFTTQQILFVIVSLMANLRIIHYHHTRAPHPKFTMTRFSRICIKMHVFSGSIGVLLPLWVFFSADEFSGKILMFICSFFDFVFCVTAYFQSPNVFGVRLIVVPMYYTCVIIKVVLNICLLQSLMLQPLGGFKSQVEWLWMMWLEINAFMVNCAIIVYFAYFLFITCSLASHV